MTEGRRRASIMKRLFPWYYKHLGHRLKVAMVFMLLLTIVTSAAIAYYYVRLSAEANYRTAVGRQLELVDAAIDQYVANIESNTEMLAKMPLVRQLDSRVTTYVDKTGPDGLVPMKPWAADPYEAELYQLLGVIKQAHGAIKNASIGVEANGGFVKYPAQPRFDGYDARERSWYKSAMAKPGEVVVSGIYTTSTEEKVILSVRTIEDTTGRIVGVVTVDFDLKALSDTVSEIVIGRGGYVLLVDREGAVLAHPNHNEALNHRPLKASLVGKKLSDIGLSQGMNGDFSAVQPGEFTWQAEESAYRVQIVPSKLEAIGIHYVVVVPEGEFTESALNIGQQLIWSSVPLGLLAIGIAVLLSNRLVKPLERLKERASAIAEGNLEAQIDLHREDEIGQLATQFNRMTEALQSARETLEVKVAQRTEELSVANEALIAANQELLATLDLLQATQQQLIQSAKLAGLGSMVAGIAHEINTPLGNAITMASYLEMALAEPQPDCQRIGEINDVLQRNLKRTGHLIERFKQVTIDQFQEVRRPVELSSVMAALLETLRYDPIYQSLDITWTCPEPLSLETSPGALGLVVSQLLENVVKHAYPAGGQVWLSGEREGDWAVIRCRDAGVGMAPLTVERLFEPFYTTQRIQGATGLGLFVAYNLVTLHLGGVLSATSDQGAGTTFEIRLPLLPDGEGEAAQ